MNRIADGLKRHRSMPEVFTKQRLQATRSHQSRVFVAGIAIAEVILDTSVSLKTVRGSLEDLKETLEFAIDVISLGTDDIKKQ